MNAKAKRILAVLVALLLAGGGITLIKTRFLGESARNATQGKKQLYHCPMHPDYVLDRPGDCPICGMRLVPMQQQTEPGAENHSQHPETAASTVPAHEAGQHSVTAGTAVEDRATVKIPPDQQHMMGIITARAIRRKLEKEVRTVGRVTYDETKVHHVHTKFEGYIEDIFVNFVGQKVSVGDPLFSVYSPEVLATENEYLLALKGIGKNSAGSALPGLNLVDSVKRRLALWDIDKREIEKIEKTGKASGTVTIYSPATGFVMQKNAVHGMRITPEQVQYDISDLSVVWVIADVYENDLPFIRTGEEADITSPYIPADSWKAHVTYVYPDLNEKTRTVKTRLELANPNFLLKPEMYTTVVIKAALGEGLVVPESAVLTTGERKLVFVKKEGGIFEPREVATGLRTNDYYQIRNGVDEGEEVVIGANFLLDSESKLKASITAMSGGHKH